jgi:outer membrane protein TolC
VKTEKFSNRNLGVSNVKAKSAVSLMLVTVIAGGQVFPSIAMAQSQAAKKDQAQQSNAAQATPTGAVMTLDQYLEQVRQGNQAYVAATMRNEGATLRQDEYKLLTRPNLIAGASYNRNQAQPISPFAAGDTKTTTYSLGVQQTTDFGLTGQLGYTITQIDTNLVPPAGIPIPADYTIATPQLTLTQSLFRNWLGGEVQANKEVLQANALATKYDQSFAQTQILAQAETAYWRLALAREGVQASKEVLELTERSQRWSANRQRLALTDRADLLQSNAALLARQLDLQVSIDEERAAARAFNTVRGVSSDVVAENLNSFDPGLMSTLQIPKRVEFRDDVKAAEARKRLAQANAKLGRARNTPIVNLTGTLGLNGLDAETSPAVRESFKDDFPNYAIGVQANIPLDFGTVSDNREGYKREEVAENVAYQRRVFEQERLWNDLTNQFQEANRRYKIAAEMEKAQREKVTYERGRHGRGRTTLYNVILFETDFAAAQYARIRAQADVLNTFAQLKTFGGGQ